MAEIFDFFPFDMAPGFGFVVVYLLISAGILVLGRMVRNELARAADEAGAPKVTAPPPTIGGYRTAAHGDWAPPLAMGVLPRGEQLWTVAWLRAGNTGVVEALMAHAGAAGWLTTTDGSTFSVTTPEPPTDRVAAAFHAALQAAGGSGLTATTVYEKAKATARSVETQLRHEAQQAGMVRSESARGRLVLVMMLAGVIAEAVGVIRIAVRPPNAPFPAYLLVAMVLVGIVAVVMARRVPDSYLAKRYLEWLDDATTSLVSDVGSGRGGGHHRAGHGADRGPARRGVRHQQHRGAHHDHELRLVGQQLQREQLRRRRWLWRRWGLRRRRRLWWRWRLRLSPPPPSRSRCSTRSVASAGSCGARPPSTARSRCAPPRAACRCSTAMRSATRWW
jgi:uncharacterized protein (TIGR04222 family)